MISSKEYNFDIERKEGNTEQDLFDRSKIANEINESDLPEDFKISNQVPANGVEILSGGSVIVDW